MECHCLACILPCLDTPPHSTRQHGQNTNTCHLLVHLCKSFSDIDEENSSSRKTIKFIKKEKAECISALLRIFLSISNLCTAHGQMFANLGTLKSEDRSPNPTFPPCKYGQIKAGFALQRQPSVICRFSGSQFETFIGLLLAAKASHPLPWRPDSLRPNFH